MKLSDRSSTAGALSKKAYTDTKAKKPTTMPVEPREDFDEHLFGAGRGMTVGDHHVDESRRHRHDDEQRDNAGQASEKTHFSSFLFGRHRRDALDTSARDCGSASVYEKGS